jgi:arylformamidase
LRLFDLTHVLEANIPVYPGTASPSFNSSSDIKENGYRERLIHIQSHTGTHIDAPYHLLENGKSLDDFELHKFFGKGFVLTNTVDNPLTIEQIIRFSDVLQSVDFVLIYSGWDKYWGEENYFNEFPVAGAKVLEYLTSFKLKGIGIDCISVDPISSKHLPNHHLLLSNEILIIENLTNLSGLVHTIFNFFCFPLSMHKADGSPVRAIAQLIE